jgi:hypothetical protein
LITSVVDTGGKFATSINDGSKFAISVNSMNAKKGSNTIIAETLPTSEGTPSSVVRLYYCSRDVANNRIPATAEKSIAA